MPNFTLYFVTYCDLSHYQYHTQFHMIFCDLLWPVSSILCPILHSILWPAVTCLIKNGPQCVLSIANNNNNNTRQRATFHVANSRSPGSLYIVTWSSAARALFSVVHSDSRTSASHNRERWYGLSREKEADKVDIWMCHRSALRLNNNPSYWSNRKRNKENG